MALDLSTPVPPDIMKSLTRNQKIMDELGASATPAIYYMSKDNMLQQEVGLPDAQTLKTIMGE